MKKISLGLFLVTSFIIGMSTFSSAEVDVDNPLSSSCSETKAGETTLYWSRRLSDGFFPARLEKKYKLYISPALSSEDFWGHKDVKYKKVATVDYDTGSGDDGYTDFKYTFDDLEADKFYRFKIEAYYGKNLICTSYCTNVDEPDKTEYEDKFFPKMKIDGNKGTLSWDKYLYADATLKIYRSDVLTSSEYEYQDVSYKEIGSVPYEDGQFTVNDLKTGKNHYYGFVIYQGDTPVLKEYNEFGTMPDAPQNRCRSGYYHFDKDHIEVPFYAETEMEPKVAPDGLIVYRKDKNGKFKKIARVKPNKNYIDKNVKPGKSYTYKARTYKKINGKTYYSKYSVEVTVSAVNRLPKLKMTAKKNDSSIIKFESTDKYNGVIRDWEDEFIEHGIYDDLPDRQFRIKKYSLDGKKWKKTDGTDIPALKPGKAIWLELENEMNKSGDYNLNFYYGNGFRYDIWYFMICNLKDKNVYTARDYDP